MEPVTAMVAVAAVSSLAQLYQSEKARGAANKRLKEIEKLFNDVKPPEFDVSITDPPQYIMTRPTPATFNMQPLDRKTFEVVGQYAPETAQFIRDQAPELVKDSDIGEQGKKAQMDALKRYTDIASSEYDPELLAALSNVERQQQAEAQSRQESIMQDAQRRGISGSGVELASQIGATEGVADRAAQAAQDAAVASYRNRLNALASGAQLGGNIRSQELQLSGRNADVINQFNQRATSRYQSYLDKAADQRNQAAIRNLENQQNIANRNVETQNRGMEVDRQRSDDLEKYRYGQDVNWLNYENQMKTQQYNQALAEQNRQNNIRQRIYDNEMAKRGAQSNVAYQRSNLDMQTARDRNAAIQGFSDAGMRYISADQQAQEREKDRQLAKQIYGVQG